MKLTEILHESKDLLQLVAEKATNSPKPAIVVYSYSFGMGWLGTMYDWMKEGVPVLSMYVAFIGGTFMTLASYQKYRREKRDAETADLNHRIAMETLRLMPVETRKGDENE